MHMRNCDKFKNDKIMYLFAVTCIQSLFQSAPEQKTAEKILPRYRRGISH